jgi:hypothetical protein
VRRSRRNRHSSNFRHPEPLESRDLLAGHGFGQVAHFSQAIAAWVAAERAFEGNSAIAHVASASAFTGRLSTENYGMHGGLTASLTDPNSSATGTASFKTYTSGGETETEFKVNVKGAAADTTLSVSVGDTVVGEITTDASGAGSLVLSSNPTGDEQQLPDNFPTNVAAGTAITVGPLSGTFAQGNSDHHHGCGGEDEGNQTRLRAPLTDSDGSATGSVYLRTSTTGDTTNTRFVVRVSGAAANSTLDVAIDGTTVGQVTTNDSGSGKLVLSSNPKNDEQPLPANFPTTITAGSTVTVGTLSGAFETAEHGLSAARFVRFRR